MKTNRAGIDLIKGSESLRLAAYLCAAGKWTIGYGHTGDVKPGDRITEHQADVILEHDLERFEREVTALVAGVACNENQFAALVSFAFNVGTPNLTSSTLLRMFRIGNARGAADQFLRWTKARDPKTGELRELRGLVTRRHEERELFLRPAGT